jgi:hypothetical protein
VKKIAAHYINVDLDLKSTAPLSSLLEACARLGRTFDSPSTLHGLISRRNDGGGERLRSEADEGDN